MLLLNNALSFTLFENCIITMCIRNGTHLGSCACYRAVCSLYVKPSGCFSYPPDTSNTASFLINVTAILHDTLAAITRVMRVRC